MRLPVCPAAVGAALLLGGCPAPSDDGEDSTPVVCEDPVVLGDANNYGFDGTLSVARTEVTAWSEKAPVDYLIDWSALTADLQGHALDPAADIDMVSIVAFQRLTPEEIEDRLSTNTLAQSDIGGYAYAVVEGRTSVQVSELTLLGNDIDIESYLTDGSATWMVLLSSGTTPGVGSRQLHFLIPTATGDTTTVQVTNTSTVLDYTVDLTSLEPAYAPEGTFVADWSGLTVDGRGSALDLADIDTAKLAWFADASFASLAGAFLDVELDADKLWSAAIEAGATLDLATLTGPEAFTGLGEGTYAFALQCSTCSNPAPVLFTELKPCP